MLNFSEKPAVSHMKSLANGMFIGTSRKSKLFSLWAPPMVTGGTRETITHISACQVWGWLLRPGASTGDSQILTDLLFTEVHGALFSGTSGRKCVVVQRFMEVHVTVWASRGLTGGAPRAAFEDYVEDASQKPMPALSMNSGSILLHT